MLYSTPVIPTDVNELVEFIAKTVRENSGRAIDGSRLAHLVRTKYPQLDYERLGIKRLGNAVDAAIAKGLVVRNSHVKHLELLPSNGPPPQIAEGRQYVRPDLWRAFVIAPNQATFLDKKTYEILEPTFDADSHASNPQFVRIKPVSAEQQTSWAVLFLNEQLIVGEKDQVIEELSRRGGRALPASVTRAWVTFRSAKIVDHVKEWAKQNQLDVSKLLRPAEPRQRGASRKATASDDAWRAALLAIVGEMTLDEMDALVLSVPVRSLKRHFSPK